jgi:sugar phosphate isomerase/epimerase
MRKSALFVVLFAVACGAARAAAAPKIPDGLTVRAVEWDMSWKPAADKDWYARVAGAVAAAAKDGADVIVFPEGFSQGRSLDEVLVAVKDAAGADRLVALGNAPHREPGWDHAVSRAYILSGGAWETIDKLDPTPAERALKPPVKPGMRLPLFRFRGGIVAVLPAYSIEKPEIAASLKKRGVNLLLVSAPSEDEEGAARVARCASARAVELGAAVVTAPPSPAAPSLQLPAQKGFDLKPQTPSGRDFRLPWKKLLDLRAPSSEARPFLDPAPYYQVEI